MVYDAKQKSKRYVVSTTLSPETKSQLDELMRMNLYENYAEVVRVGIGLLIKLNPEYHAMAAIRAKSDSNGRNIAYWLLRMSIWVASELTKYITEYEAKRKLRLRYYLQQIRQKRRFRKYQRERKLRRMRREWLEGILRALRLCAPKP